MAEVKKKRRRRADGLATRQRILDVALKRFAAGGYEATSLRQIAGAASIDIATLKYHYEDKPALFAEVYSHGHGRFIDVIMPVMMQFGSAQNQEDIRKTINYLVETIHSFVSEHTEFVKLTLFRLMEDSLDVIGLEDELQNVALSALEEVFSNLNERGLISKIDARAMVVFLISSFSMWYVTANVKPNWLGDPHITTTEGRQRSEMFFRVTIERMFGVEQPA